MSVRPPGIDDHAPSPRRAIRGRVRCVGADFVDDEGAFVPRGVGSYPLLDHAGRGHSQHLDDIFAQAHDLGRPLIRTNAFFMGERHPGRLRNTDGSLHEPGFVALDRVLARAADADVRLILVVANNWPDYGGAGALAEALLGRPWLARLPRFVRPRGASGKDRFYTNPRCIDAQRTFIRALVGRRNTVNGRAYATDKTVFAWELANEARFEVPRPGYADALVRWALATRGAFDDAGATQPVGWGGSGHRGQRGEDIEAILRARAVDFATLHLYPFLIDASLLTIEEHAERARRAGEMGGRIIADRAALARDYDVPLLVEEHGWKTGDHTDHAERAAVMGAFMRVARTLGVGTLPWMIGERGRQDYDGLLIRPTHAPEWTVMKTW